MSNEKSNSLELVKEEALLDLFKVQLFEANKQQKLATEARDKASFIYSNQIDRVQTLKNKLGIK